MEESTVQACLDFEPFNEKTLALPNGRHTYYVTSGFVHDNSKRTTEGRAKSNRDNEAVVKNTMTHANQSGFLVVNRRLCIGFRSTRNGANNLPVQRPAAPPPMPWLAREDGSLRLHVDRPPPVAYGVSIDGPVSARGGGLSSRNPAVEATARDEARDLPVLGRGVVGFGSSCRCVARARGSLRLHGRGMRATATDRPERHTHVTMSCRCLPIGRSVGLLLRYRMSTSSVQLFSSKAFLTVGLDFVLAVECEPHTD
jgi:hypothetical protein